MTAKELREVLQYDPSQESSLGSPVKEGVQWQALLQDK